MSSGTAVATTRIWRGVGSFLLPNLADPSTHEGPPMGARVWRRVLVGLHASFGILAALAVLTILTNAQSEPWCRPAALAAIGAIVLAYTVAGRVGLTAARVSRRGRALIVAYLVVLVAGVGVLARTEPDTLFIFFIVYAQVWSLVDRTVAGTFWSLMLVAASIVGMALRPAPDRPDLVSLISNQAVGVAFALLMGIWVHSLFDRSREQARLIEKLESARAEVAALERERGAQAERERMARDVHDTLAQGYTSILMLARTAVAQLGADPAAARERLELVEEVASENLAQARALVAAQSPVELDGTSLRDALTQLAGRFTRETGIEVDIRFSPEPAGDGTAGPAGLRPAEELMLLRAAQEALTNARRHASPTRVSLTLATARPGEATLRVVDDGVGFAVGAETGSGLVGLRRRMEEAGGELLVTSAPGAGTQLVARVVRGR
ncbi:MULTISPECIES: sensor histidine kinase [unclassified Pseudofrankia]|uniref:sensor histidine kinase n=1 Tax=unclassified Pseudofrankia TaxID=2994372 RepID=UPI0009F2BCFF|nr:MULTISPECIES: sensor histidine kinase [unclassified Pseudofrankia]MDT3438631.1 sensor histidine kinase [Pseudofrankia sp. BMG5.37]